MIELTPVTGRRIGLDEKQVAIVVLSQHRFNRQQIADLFSISKQGVRDILGGMCDYYSCPASELYENVITELATNAPENSEVR